MRDIKFIIFYIIKHFTNSILTTKLIIKEQKLRIKRAILRLLGDHIFVQKFYATLLMQHLSLSSFFLFLFLLSVLCRMVQTITIIWTPPRKRHFISPSFFIFIFVRGISILSRKILYSASVFYTKENIFFNNFF